MKKLSVACTANLIALIAFFVSLASCHLSYRNLNQSTEAEYHSRVSALVASIAKIQIEANALYVDWISVKASLPGDLDTKELHEKIIETKIQADAINPSFESLQTYSLEDIGRLKIKAQKTEMQLEALREEVNKRAKWYH